MRLLWSFIAVTALVLVFQMHSSVSAAEAADPCAALPPASSPGFEPQLDYFLNSLCYQNENWEHDATVRTTHGLHPFVKIWYSPSLWTWLLAGNRTAEIPDGAILVKEQFKTLTSPLMGWTVMVKDRDGSWDGWYWADLLKPAEVQPPTPLCGKPQQLFVGFGLTCMNCHGSAADLQGTFASTEHVQDLPRTPAAAEAQFFVHPASPRLADPDAIAASLAPRNTRLASLIYPATPLLPLSAVACMPAESLDHVVSTGKSSGPAEFMTSNQCAPCHDATATLFRSDLPNMLWPDPAHPQANLSEYGEWRFSMMGLAGRDPVFFSQLNSESTLHGNIRYKRDPRAFVQNLCLHCHGVMGQRQLEADKGPGAMLTRDVLNDPRSKYGALARDGVSCAVCHHIAPDGLEHPSSFTGNFNLGPADELDGPFKDVITYPMESAIGATPVFGSAIQNPGLCGSCHAIILPVFDRFGRQVREKGRPKTFVEQATYLEWLNSRFNRGVPCQTCHMPSEFHGDPLNPNPVLSFKIANIEDETFPEAPFLAPVANITMDEQKPYARHTLLGNNVFTLEMFSQFRNQLGLYDQDPYIPFDAAAAISGLDTAISESADQASKRSASVKVVAVSIKGSTLGADVMVRNLAGHSFPSGVGFRRAFVNFQVFDSSGRELWASGDTSSDGVIVGANGQPLATEFFSRFQQSFQPHFWRGHPITRPDQVQIYEELETDPQGQLTTSFLSLDRKVKDNRLQPQGWSIKGPYADETGPAGGAVFDPDYTTVNSSGSNTISYRIPVTAKLKRAASVRATLYYQAIPPYYLRQRAQDASGVDTDRLRFYATNLQVKGTAIDGWRLEIASDSSGIR
jgi:hypothetical protein